MRARLQLVVLVGLTSLPACIQAATPSRQFGPIRDRLDHLDGSTESSNWSGYALTGSSFTQATGSWVVPTAKCTGVKQDEYAAFWVGIDGYNSSTIEQVGTLSDCLGKTPSYYAWYEFYPQQGMTEVTSFSIKPGDRISATVAYNGSVFTITITDETIDQSFSADVSVPQAARTSAEWIAEAPCCTTGNGAFPMSDFGTVTFGEDSTSSLGTNYAASSTATGPIGDYPAGSIVVISKVSSTTSPQVSNCSGISTDGTSFSCTWGQ